MRWHIVTGANGHIGSQLILEIIASSFGDQVVALARSQGQPATRRVMEALSSAAQRSGKILTSDHLQRLRICEAGSADTARILGGMLGNDQRIFWHLEGTVRSASCTAKEHERSHVESTACALELARALRAHEFNLVSSAYVVGDQVGWVNIESEDDAPDVDNPYELAKLASEVLVRDAAAKYEMAYRIFRVGSVAGHSRDLLSDPSCLSSCIDELLDVCEAMGNAAMSDGLCESFPAGSTVDVVPVEVCAKEMLNLARNALSRDQRFHIVGSETVLTRNIVAKAMSLSRNGSPPAPNAAILANDFLQRVSARYPQFVSEKLFDRGNVIRYGSAEILSMPAVREDDLVRAMRHRIRRRNALRAATAEAKLFARQRGLPSRFNVAGWWLDQVAGRAPGKVALVQGNRKVRYSELAEDVKRAAQALHAMNVRSGVRVAVLAHDSPEHVACLLALMHVGAIAVFVNPLLAARDINSNLSQADAGLTICDHESVAKLARGVWSGTVVLQDTVLARWDIDEACLPPVPAATGPLDIAFGIFTSGSTGKSKLIEHRHQDPLIALERYASQLLDFRADDVVFSVSRTSFAFGLQNLLMTLLNGATAVLTPAKITPDSIMETINASRPTVMFGVPTIYQRLLDDVEVNRRLDAGSLRICVAAGERLPYSIASRWEARCKVRILDSLGSTEAFSTYLSNISDVTKPGATGKLVPGFDAVLRDENGRACRNGEPGVLWLRGPSLSTDGTRSDSGWFCTNDVFIRDADGYFFFQGRSDDMFKVAGQWIAPLDIEEVLLRHPAVREAAVVAHDDGQGTLQPKAWVVVDEPSEGLARELQRWCKNELDSRRHPHLIEFVEQLPRTATGKLTRAPLRQTQFAPVVWDELNPVAV